jgi:hypothetical protein
LDASDWEVYIKIPLPLFKTYHNIVLNVVSESLQVEVPLTFFAFLLTKRLKIHELLNLISI